MDPPSGKWATQKNSNWIPGLNSELVAELQTRAWWEQPRVYCAEEKGIFLSFPYEFIANVFLFQTIIYIWCIFCYSHIVYNKYSRIHMYFKILFSYKCGGFICPMYKAALDWQCSKLSFTESENESLDLSGVIIPNIWDLWGLYSLILVFLYIKFYKYFCLVTVTVDGAQKIKVRCVCFLRNLCVSEE